MNKIDYYEYEIENYKSYNFYEVFDYFIGLTEIGIQLLYFYNYNNNFFISHKRVSMSMKKRDLYNNFQGVSVMTQLSIDPFI